MHRSLIAIRYAKALYLKGIEDNILEEIATDIQQVHQTLTDSPDLYQVFHQPTLDTSKKRAIFDQVFEKHIHSITLDFLELIIQNKREIYLEDIFRNFTDLYNEYRGIKTVLLTTTVDLTDKEKHSVSEFVKKNFDAQQIDLDVEVDKDIIGGFIIQINDQLFDASVRRQLDKIRQQFLHKKFNTH